VHLRAIKLRGFKSFPDPVEIRLEPGVAVVVGPNGSGKSNVADAIVWAAGSLAPGELRAEKPDDVLFSGSATRGPADFCEVELLFDNEAGDGPVPYAELSVKRRLHRGGEGQYLLNGAAVRRIDLVELLADLGLGGGMHSIIGQGRVEEVLGASSQRRRELIEEAAGLGRFKRRKHRAELKLARVAVQVERARDVEEEVRKRLRPLALQATAAERAEKLALEIARLRARIAQLDVLAADARLDETESRRTAALLARRHAEERLEALLADRARAEDELGDAAGRREAATAALYRLRSAAERVEMRREAAVDVLGAVRAALAEQDVPGEGPRAEELEAAAEAAAAAEHARAEALAAAGAAQAELVAALRGRRAEAHARFEEVAGQRAGLDDELREATALRESAAEAGRRLAAARDRLLLRVETAEALAAELAADLARARPPGAGPTPDEVRDAADEANAAARRAARERDELGERAGLARERLAAVQATLAEREGIPPAARALAEAGERLAHTFLTVEPGAERAVAAALAWRASAVVASDPASALGLLERARAGGLGSLGVLIAQPVPARRSPPAAGAIALDTLAAGGEALLAGVWLVDAERLLEAEHGVVVTREGHGYDVERGELWLAAETPEATLLELDGRARELAAEADELERAAGRAASEAERLVAEARRAESAYAEVAPLAHRPALAREAVEPLAAAAERLRTALARATQAVAGLEPIVRARADESRARAEDLARLLHERAADEAGARPHAEQAAARLAAAEVTLAHLGGEPAEAVAPAAADVGSLSREAERLAAAAEQAAHVAAERAATLAGLEREVGGRLRRHADRAALTRSGALAGRVDEALAGALATAGRLESPLRARVDAGAHRVGEIGSALRTLGAAEVELRRAAGEAAEALSVVDVERAGIQAERGEAARRLAEAGTDDPAEGDDRDALAERVERLERRREALGRVNPLAKEEYEHEKTRLEELATQRADLEASLAELERLRADLADTVERRFAETFGAVEERFTEVARTLFPGGEGRLRLTIPDESDGEEATDGSQDADGTSRFPQTPSTGPIRGQAAVAAGVEVELRPAGKKITRLSLLSGGEKALGAISFLFALFLARPCPFYLLDEVEAALDDANISRFVELLRSYSDRAQFVVITHQKRTMEAADVLYGVTMAGAGVSEIVSRRLPQDDRDALAVA
jgi:chromosome segregation protein